MHPEDIKAALRKRGSTLAAVAAELGVSHTAVSHVIAGRITSARVARHIAKLLGRRASSLWPGRYREARR